MNRTLKSTLVLTLTAMIWGFAFAVQRFGMEYIGPFMFSGIRAWIGVLTLLVCLFVRGSRRRTISRRLQNRRIDADDAAEATRTDDRAQRRLLFQGGMVCGLILFAAANFQQVGLVFTTASKTGFITTLYIVLVPIFGIFLRHRIHWNTWAGVLLAAAGLYLLCFTEAMTIEPGDLIVVIGAAFWAFHILAIDHYAPRLDVVRLSCLQFMVMGAVSLLVSFFADGFFVPDFQPVNLLAVLPALLYTGVLSSGLGFTLQAVGQKYANPAAASIIMSTEAVFGVIGGFLLLGERLSLREIIGCLLMFTAVILAQLPIRPNRKASDPPSLPG